MGDNDPCRVPFSLPTPSKFIMNGEHLQERRIWGSRDGMPSKSPSVDRFTHAIRRAEPFDFNETATTVERHRECDTFHNCELQPRGFAKKSPDTSHPSARTGKSSDGNSLVDVAHVECCLLTTTHLA